MNLWKKLRIKTLLWTTDNWNYIRLQLVILTILIVCTAINLYKILYR